MEVKQLRTFLAAANAKSFLGAAESLYVSRQAVSKTIAQLESELGTKLLMRTQSGVMMTPAGIYFYGRAKTVVTAFDRLQTEMENGNHSFRPTITIYLAFGAYGLFADKLFQYGKEHDLEMEVHAHGCLDSDCEVMLNDRHADAIVSFTPLTKKISENALVLKSPVVFLVNRSNPVAHSPEGWPNALFRAPLLLYTGGKSSGLWWSDDPRPGDICCSDLDYLFKLLRENKGIMPIPEALVPEYLDFAEAVPGFPGMDPACIYFSSLFSSYYDALTYDLIESIRDDVFLED